MDPTTTLFTFMLQTLTKSQSVDLVGSWDNFAKRYPMQRDDRRGRGHWRGCYSFKDIICDGDGERTPKRNGGLKMGHSYWYYYELDDGTEIHDTSLASTTSCPFLPGQPVNLLYVPVEVSPLRERSASMNSIASDNLMTMNPEDKFLTPRVAPPTPRALPRLNTASAVLDRKRSARSASPGRPKSPWSARSLFGLRSPTSAVSQSEDRGRMLSPVSSEFDDYGDANISSPTLIGTSAADRQLFPLSRSAISSREASPISLRNGLYTAGRETALSPLSRDSSPMRHYYPVMPDHSMNSVALEIPDQIIEEEELEEDDTNFAELEAPLPDLEKGPITTLSPPPSRQRPASPPLANLEALALTDVKPLPTIPDEEISPSYSFNSPSLVPSPLHLHPHAFTTPPTSHSTSSSNLPRSHFSIDTMASSFISSSPTSDNGSSHSGSSSPPSIYDSHDDLEDEVGVVAADDSFHGFNFNFGFTHPHSSPQEDDHSDRPAPAHARTSYIPHRGFQGYSLPMGEYGSEQTIGKGALPLSDSGVGLAVSVHDIAVHPALPLPLDVGTGLGLGVAVAGPRSTFGPLRKPSLPTLRERKELQLQQQQQQQQQQQKQQSKRETPVAVRELDQLLEEMGWMGSAIMGK